MKNKININEVKFFETKRLAQDHAEANFPEYRRTYFWHNDADGPSNGIQLSKNCIRFVLCKNGLKEGSFKDIESTKEDLNDSK